MPNYLATLIYDGTDFHGWQSQPNARTVQDALEGCLARLFAPGVRATAAGRTDAGVHALAMPVNFSSDLERNPDVVARALNSMLPEDVRVRECRVVPESFSARFQAVSRTYEYKIECASFRDPISRRFAWQLPVELNWDLVESALPAVLGEHDFTSFRGSGCAAKSPVRKMISARLMKFEGGRFAFEFEADGFLRGMVRSMVGTLVEIGREARPAEDIAGLLAIPCRDEAGMTAPPQGLYFVRARYPEFP